MNKFRITRIYTDDNGESRFKELHIPLYDKGTIGYLSEELPAKGVILREVEPHYDFDFHHAPQRQYIILLNGEIEIETSTGEKRRFRGGDVILAEDTTGKGHRTRNILPAKRKSIFLTLP